MAVPPPIPPVTSVLFKRVKPPPTWYGRLLRQLLKGLGILLAACLVAYPFTPHDASKNIVPSISAEKLAKRPKDTTFAKAIECVHDQQSRCVASKFLTLANQAANAVLDRTKRAQSLHSTALEASFAKLMARDLHFAWVVLLGTFVIWLITQLLWAYKRRKLLRVFTHVKRPRERSTLVVLALLLFAAIRPDLVVAGAALPQKAVVAIASIKSDSLAQAIKERLVLDPLADALYRGRTKASCAPIPTRENARPYADATLNGQPIDNDVVGYHECTGDGHTEVLAISSYIYITGVNGATWLLALLVLVFRQLFGLLVLGLIPGLGAWVVMSRRRDLRRGLKFYLGLVFTSLVGLFASAGLLWLFNWASIVVIDVAYKLPMGGFSGMRWYLALIGLILAGSATMATLWRATKRMHRYMKNLKKSRRTQGVVNFIVGPPRWTMPTPVPMRPPYPPPGYMPPHGRSAGHRYGPR